MLHKALAASAFLGLALSACSPQLVVTATPTPESTTSFRVSVDGGSATTSPLLRWVRPPDGRLLAIIPVDAPADAGARVEVEAVDGVGCVLARGAAFGDDVPLTPVLNCGAEITPPTPTPQLEPMPPQPEQRDSDGDGVLDSFDQCPDVVSGATPDPRRLGCPAPTPQDTDGDGVTDDVDACPRQPSGSYPDPARRGCPQPDSDGDGVGDRADVCPGVAAGSQPSPTRPGCPAPREVLIPLGQPMLSGPVAVAGDGYVVKAGFDFATSKVLPGRLDWAVSMPPEAATARSVSVSYDLAATLSWSPRSPGCVDGYRVVAGGTSVCVRPQVWRGLVVDGVEGGAVVGAVPGLSVEREGDVDVTGASSVKLRLALTGDVGVGSSVVAAARVRLFW